jgi:hypothetical protein
MRHACVRRGFANIHEEILAMTTLRPIHRPGFRGMLAALAISLASFAPMAQGEDVKLSLTGDAEVPPVKTMASGSGTITVNADMSVAGGVTTTGVAGTMAHIHHGAAGVNGPVLIPLSKSGDNGWMVPAGAKLSDSQYKAFKAGELYVNVHSADNKGGEIRGQLKP